MSIVGRALKFGLETAAKPVLEKIGEHIGQAIGRRVGKKPDPTYNPDPPPPASEKENAS